MNLILSFFLAAYISFQSFLPSSNNDTPFTALHTYFISTTGSDSNAGDAAHPWATPNHSVVCGDVIIATAGSYTTQFGTNNWGTVSNCPSTTGGIDGTGGIYFATVICGGTDLTSCPVNSTSEDFRIDASNWAAEGFAGTSSSTCFSATSESNTILHHIAFINDIASGCSSSGFNSYSWHTFPAGGVDQTAVVGAISYNAAYSSSTGNCTSGISLIPVNGPDSSAGTHVFVAGYFGYKNVNGSGCDSPGATTDGEGIIFDSWACSLFTRQGAVEQSVVWLNGSAGFEAFPNCTGTNDLSQIYIRSFTSYNNFQDPFHKGTTNGELLLLNVFKNAGAFRSVQNSIFQADIQTPGNAAPSGSLGQPVFGAGVYADAATTADIDVSNNYIWQQAGSTTTSAGNPNTDVYNNGSHNTTTFPFGTNVYSNAGFSNPAGLPTTAPNCAGYTNTTDCMNTGYGVASKMAPSGGAAGKGYAAPTSCTADSLYPTWIKGVVFIVYTGAALVQRHGLVTTPCGL